MAEELAGRKMTILFVFLCVLAVAICQAQPNPPPPPPPPIFGRRSYGVKINSHSYSQPSATAPNNNNIRNNVIQSNIRNTNYQQPNTNYRLPIASITNYKPPSLPPANKNNNRKRPRPNNRPAANNNQPPAAANSWSQPSYGRPSRQGCTQFCARTQSSRESVCGKDNVTYDSECEMKCVGVQRHCEGICPCLYEHPAPNSGCWCWRENGDPVCTMDGTTVANKCEAGCERKIVVREEACWASRY